MSWRALACGAAALSITAIAGCGSSSTTSTQAFVNPDVGVTSVKALPLRTNEAPYLLIDRSNPTTAYLSGMDLQQKVCRFYTSTDRGFTWTQGTAPTLPPYTDCGIGTTQPQNVRTELAQGPTGTLYYAYQANDPTAITTVGGPRSVLVGRSTDGGKTWATVAVGASPTPTTPADVQAYMEVHIAVDPANAQNVYAMWRRSYPTVPGVASRPTRPFMAVSTDGGATFGTPFMMFDKNNGFDGPRPIVVNGKLYAFYRVSAPAAAAGAPPNDTTLVASVSTDQGKTWQDSTIIAARDASEPIPLFDSARNVFDVVWHDNRPVNNAQGHLNVYFSTSKDAVSWSTPVLINDDQPDQNLIQHWYPQVALAPSGRLDVVWYDFRDDTHPAPTPSTKGAPLGLQGIGIGHAASVYMSSSSDAGATWSSNVKLNTVPIDRTKGTWNGEYFFVVPPTVASGNEFTLAAWSDTRNGDVSNQSQDIYTGLVTYGAPADAPAPVASDDHRALIATVCAVGGALAGAGISLLVIGMLLRRRRQRTLAEA